MEERIDLNDLQDFDNKDDFEESSDPNRTNPDDDGEIPDAWVDGTCIGTDDDEEDDDPENASFDDLDDFDEDDDLEPWFGTDEWGKEDDEEDDGGFGWYDWQQKD